MKIIDNLGKLNREIAAIGKLTTTLANRIQVAAASCVVHAIKHDNATPSLELFKACGRIIDRPTLKKWLDTFGITITFDKDSGGFKCGISREVMDALKAEYANDVAACEARILAARIDEHGKDPAEFDGFDLMAKIAALIKQAERIKDGKDAKRPADHPNNDFRGLASLKNMVVASHKAQVKDGNPLSLTH